MSTTNRTGDSKRSLLGGMAATVLTGPAAASSWPARKVERLLAGAVRES